MIQTEFAPAKVNLFLHVGSPRPNGRHPICSLATFADVGDELSAEPASRYSLAVEGPFAGDVGPATENLVTRALEVAGARPMAVRLVKNLPAASGLGGGSSDAGAALRLAMRLDPAIGADRADAAARAVGADGPLCLRARAALATGDGDVLSDPAPFPDLACVLINPGAASPTGPVYRAYDDDPHPDGSRVRGTVGEFRSTAEVAAFLAACRNDLEYPAVRLQPIIGQVLSWLRGRPEPLLARMSGSGATCFALCVDAAAARLLSDAARLAYPDWWVRPCRLAGHRARG